MDVLRVGPLALPVDVLLLLFAFIVALLACRRLAAPEQRQATEDWLWRLLIGSVAAARLGFVAQYWSVYQGSLLDILDIRDGGFDSRFGLAFLAIGSLFLLIRKPQFRKPLLSGLIVATSVWMGGGLALQAMGPGQVGLPSITVYSLQGKPLDISSLKGRPVVINLWATWCPPCRREMPVFQEAQKAYSDVVFVFANQGESSQQVMAYLQSHSLVLSNVTVDPSGLLGKAFDAPGLPTTLFFNADGEQVDRRMGELGHASLLAKLSQIREIEKTE